MTSCPHLHLSTDLSPSPDDIGRVRAGLMRYNERCVGSAAVELFGIFLRDETTELRGGLVGFFAWQWMSVEWLWVTEAERGLGHGSALLRAAEALARDRGSAGVKLDTYEFQAKPFYERHGYAVFGVLEGYPAGTRTYYMHKAL
jgi:GNAT superfamily N-acetyltransferase